MIETIRTEIDISTSTIRVPLLHDGSLDGLLLSQNGGLCVFIRDQDDERLTLLASGVKRLRADDFREGNNIFDVAVETGKPIKEKRLRWLFDVSDSDPPMPYLEKLATEVSGSTLLLIEVSSSYGCKLALLCKEFRMVRGHYLCERAELE